MKGILHIRQDSRNTIKWEPSMQAVEIGLLYKVYFILTFALVVIVLMAMTTSVSWLGLASYL